jgi:hypothetical protein
MTEKTVNKAPSGRPKRQPVGLRNRLTVADKDPNYEYRWINANADGGDRPAILQESGYEYVPKSDARRANIRVSDAGALGAFETTPGGGGDTLVLMRQKREYYEEDQKAKQARVDETDRAQHRTPDGLYGSITSKKE